MDEKKTKSTAIASQIDSSSRRKAVKTLVGGVSALAAYHVLPTRWSKPFVEQIMLPAHAGTSGCSLSDPCSVSVTSGTTLDNEIDILVTGFVTPATSGLPTTIAVTAVGGNNQTANTTTSATGTFSAAMTITGGPGITSVTAVTTVTGATGSATCSATVPGPTSFSPTTPSQ